MSSLLSCLVSSESDKVVPRDLPAASGADRIAGDRGWAFALRTRNACAL